ncbi:Store-operated calcium entry-associated regulatory factor [Rhizophlyctis rosea]|nr:Store-operated calcium entry-associated regulatory factor [Rhizophlyctis rosea]
MRAFTQILLAATLAPVVFGTSVSEATTTSSAPAETPSTPPTSSTRIPVTYEIPKIKLQDVQSITFDKTRNAISRRHGRVANEMRCTAGVCYSAYDHRLKGPEIITCNNIAFEESGVKWDCIIGKYPPGEDGSMYFLDKTVVKCEGYDHDNDPFVLPGSCWVSYELHRTPAAQAEYEAALRREKAENEARYKKRYEEEKRYHSYSGGNFMASLRNLISETIRIGIYLAIAYFAYRLIFATPYPGQGYRAGYYEPRPAAGDGQVLERLFFMGLLFNFFDNLRRRI